MKVSIHRLIISPKSIFLKNGSKKKPIHKCLVGELFKVRVLDVIIQGNPKLKNPISLTLFNSVDHVRVFSSVDFTPIVAFAGCSATKIDLTGSVVMNIKPLGKVQNLKALHLPVKSVIDSQALVLRQEKGELYIQIGTLRPRKNLNWHQLYPSQTAVR